MEQQKPVCKVVNRRYLPSPHLAVPYLAFNDPVPEHSLIQLILFCLILSCQPQIYLPGVPGEGILQVGCKIHCKPGLHKTASFCSSFSFAWYVAQQLACNCRKGRHTHPLSVPNPSVIFFMKTLNLYKIGVNGWIAAVNMICGHTVTSG